MNVERGYLTKRHGALYADVGIGKLEVAIRVGELRSFRLGRKTLLLRSDLDEWIARHEMTPIERQASKSELQQLLNRAITHARKEMA